MKFVLKHIIKCIIYLILTLIYLFIVSSYFFWFARMPHIYLALVGFIIVFVGTGYFIFKKGNIFLRIFLLILLCSSVYLILERILEIEKPKIMERQVSSPHENCEDYGTCYEGDEVTRGKETFIMNKENCLKYDDWEWHEKGKYCKIFSSWID